MALYIAKFCLWLTTQAAFAEMAPTQPQQPLRVSPGLPVLDKDFFEPKPKPETQSPGGREVIERSDSTPESRKAWKDKCKNADLEAERACYKAEKAKNLSATEQKVNQGKRGVNETPSMEELAGEVKGADENED